MNETGEEFEQLASSPGLELSSLSAETVMLLIFGPSQPAKVCKLALNRTYLGDDSGPKFIVLDPVQGFPRPAQE